MTDLKGDGFRDADWVDRSMQGLSARPRVILKIERVTKGLPISVGVPNREHQRPPIPSYIASPAF